MVHDRRLAEAAGRRGERLAAWWLRLKGWRILDTRVRTPAGEVDLVAKRGNLVAFVEVKMRKSAAERDIAIDERRLARGAAAAEEMGGAWGRERVGRYVETRVVAVPLKKKRIIINQHRRE